MRTHTRDEQALALRFSHLPLPVEAIDCEPWHEYADGWRRHFLIREWEIGGLWVSVAGDQNHEGVITQWLRIGGDDKCTVADQREWINAILEARHLLDSLLDVADAQQTATTA